MMNKTDKQACWTAEELLADDAIGCICSMLRSATRLQVREALRSVKYGGVDAALHLVVCEYLLPQDVSDGTARKCAVVAANDLTVVLCRMRAEALLDAPSARHTEDGAQSETTKCSSGELGLGRGREGITPHTISRCIFITSVGDARGSEDTTVSLPSTTRVPLELHQLNVHAMEMCQPLSDLQSLLQRVYEPVLHQRRDGVLYYQLRELVHSIRSRYHFFTEVDLMRFVHAKLLDVCRNNPAADLHELVGLLHDHGGDVNLEEVLAAWSPCCSVLEVTFESNTVNDDRIANPQTIDLSGVTCCAPHNNECNQGYGNVTNVNSNNGGVLEEVAYWHAAQRWIEHIRPQLRSREWRLAHYFLLNHVPTSYEKEFDLHRKLVHSYEQHAKGILQLLPHMIDISDIETFLVNATRIINTAVGPGVYPRKRRAHLVNCVAHNIMEQFVALATGLDLLHVQPVERQLQSLDEIVGAIMELRRCFAGGVEAARGDLEETRLLDATQGRSSEVTCYSGAGAREPASLTLCSLLVERMVCLKNFLNEHFHYYRTLEQTFAGGGVSVGLAPTLSRHLVEAYNRFTAEVAEHHCLWDVSSTGRAKYQQISDAYRSRVSRIDDRLALHVGTMLASAQKKDVRNSLSEGPASCVVGEPSDDGCPLYRVYSQFSVFGREKVLAVLSNFRTPLREQVDREINDLCEEYFGRESCPNAVRATVARLGVTDEVGRILWERSLQRRLEVHIERRDTVSEYGWRQLLLLRTLEHRWCLNESLARFFGVRLQDIVADGLIYGSEVHGTAYALAFLASVHAKNEAIWSRDPYIDSARQYLRENGPQSLETARMRLVLLRTSCAWGSKQSERWDVNNFRDSVAQKLQERLEQWCNVTQRKISSVDVDADAMTMKGPFLSLMFVERGPDVGGSGGDNSSIMFHRSSDYSSSDVSQAHQVVVPNFPREMHALLRDFYTLNNIHQRDEDKQLFTSIRRFFLNNETRFRIANSFTELIHAFEAALGGDEMLMTRLITEEYTQVCECIVDGAKLRWLEEDKLLEFVQCLSHRVDNFCSAAAKVRAAVADVECILQQLHDQTIMFSRQNVVDKVEKLCEIVTRVTSEGNGREWYVGRIQPRLDAALSLQLQAHLHRWTAEFLSMEGDTRFLDPSACTEEYKLRPLRISMRVLFKGITLDMPEAACRYHWLNMLNNSFAWLLTVPALCGSSCHSSQQPSRAAQAFGGHLTTRMPEAVYRRLVECLKPQALAGAITAIERSIQGAFNVEKQWRRGQQLLNLEVGVLQQRLGDDFERWKEALRHIHEFARTLMDHTQPNILVGGILIVASEAQKELGRKLDNATQYINLRYREVVSKHLELCHRRIMDERAGVEKCDVINSVDDACLFICELPTIYARLDDSGRRIVPLVAAGEYLKCQGLSLPDSAICVKRVQEELKAYRELIARKVKAVELRRPFLRESVRQREMELLQVITEVERTLTELDKQIQLRERHDKQRLEQLAESMQERFYDVQRRIQVLEDQGSKLAVLCKALGVQPVDEGSLQRVTSHAENLRWVFGHLLEVGRKLNRLSQIPFSEVDPQQLHEDLVALQGDVQGFPAVVRGHPAHDELVHLIEERLAARWIIQELCSKAMMPIVRAERHWSSLRSKLGEQWKLEDLTVGDIWRSGPVAKAKIYYGVLDAARGEHRLETRLEQIVAFWNSFEFDTTVYKKKHVLIRGWDAVFVQLADDIDTLQGFHLSPFYGASHIAASVTEWESRLNLFSRVLEVLMGVQRKWVHLDGLFSCNEDICQQLSSEGLQFARVTWDLWNLMPYRSLSLGSSEPEGHIEKIVVKMRDFLEEKRLLSSLERLEGRLTCVQRALNRYLDGQRCLFPRFFYVGDDDLLETLGSGDNSTLLGKHLSKMFTAVARLIVKDVSTSADVTDQRVVGFACEEGEEVVMCRSVPLVGQPLHVIFNMVETVMVETLRRLTLSATASLNDAGCVTAEWMGSFPLQVVCLAFQVWWSQLQEQSLRTCQEQRGMESATAVLRMISLLDQLALEVTAAWVTSPVRRASEELITIAVYQRDVSRSIETNNVTTVEDFEWLRVLRLYIINPAAPSHSVDAALCAGAHNNDGAGTICESDCRELHCCMADASLVHGFEYLGWHRRLVQTPLTDRCYLTMMQALHVRLGGSPVGPAGTGKTETVKSLGAQLGRHVVVFNCTDTFDSSAISRILLGLCQVGAWGCFDEFNRLEERVLSVVAQQIRSIQEALRDGLHSVTVSQHQVPLKANVALFITMNPDFADRSQIPGNLKQLFRTVTMVVPDREAIAEVMLFAQGYRTAETLSRKVVPLFDLCREQLSQQSHYDFGLRALKSVLIIAGEAKHRGYGEKDNCVRETSFSAVASSDDSDVSNKECELVLCSLINTIIPRLVSEDVALFYPLLRDFFPGRPIPDVSESVLRSAVEEVCVDTHYTPAPAWVEKVCQLYRTGRTRHGLMLVGPSGTGKTSCWKTLLRAMSRLSARDGCEELSLECCHVASKVHQGGHLEVHAYVIDPKAMTKAELFGVFEPTTREWRDGVFTSILRQIVNSTLSSEHAQQQHWIVFDGDVDPLWVENLNSLLDDSKIYTLPNGERLSLPPSARIVFEVQDLRYATPATVSRCGMVWFSHGTLPVTCLLNRNLEAFRRIPMINKHGEKRVIEVCGDFEGTQTQFCGAHFTVHRTTMVSDGDPWEAALGETTVLDGNSGASAGSRMLQVRLAATAISHAEENPERPPEAQPRRVPLSTACAERDILELQAFMVGVWAPAFTRGGLLERAFEVIRSERYWGKGIMEHNDLCLLRGVHSLLLDGIWKMWQVREQWGALPTERVMRSYAEKLLNYAVFWSFGAALSDELRIQLADDIGVQLLGRSKDMTLMDVEPNPVHGTWGATRERVKQINVDPGEVGFSNVVIPTVDACRNKALLEAWITGGSAVILCGPPGSGKTMLVTSLLRDVFTHESVFLNFSSGTRPETIIRALEQYCSVQNHAHHGPVMAPTSGKRLVLFCDEVNLPALDPYGTQPVVQFLRQLIERRGYYRSRDNVWVAVQGVQVIGACNPPTDKGRVSLSHRFLRWAPVLFVDFPSEESLQVIYASYCTAILSFSSRLQRAHPQRLSAAMVDMYTASRARFSTWQQPHYVYSPRELTRWIRALRGAVLTWSDRQRCELTVAELVQLALHEGLRIFQDRLVQDEEREWAHRTAVECFARHFPELDGTEVRQPAVFSALVDGVYTKRTKDELFGLVEDKARAFCEGEVDAELVVFDTMVDHVLRIDRVLRQPSGHMVLAGASGVGKTIITRLVAWMNGMSVFRIDADRGYQLADYERDLREVLRRAGCGSERICFIFEDSNAMETGFLEYINALLPSGEIPGLFDGEKWSKLMDDIRAGIEAQQSLKACSGGSQYSPNVLSYTGHERRLTPTRAPTRSIFDEDPVEHRSGLCASRVDGMHNFDHYSLPFDESMVPLACDDYVDVVSEHALYRWFVDNVQRNLHVVFVTDPSAKEFSEHVVTSPALFNRCTIDWFGEWDRIARTQLAGKLTQSIDITFSPAAFSGSEEVSRHALAEALADIHEATEEVNQITRQRNKDFGMSITPRHFTDLLQQLKFLYEEKKCQSMEQLTHLRNGLAKLAATSEEVEKQQTQLREYEITLDERSARAQGMLDRIVSETERTKEEKREAEELRKQLKEEEDLILADRKLVEMQLSEAAPALREAEEGLNSIKQEYLREMRGYTTPPTMVKRVLETVLVVLGEKRAGEWDVIKHYVRRDDFIASVKAFQARDVTAEAIQTVRGMLQEDGFTYEAAMRASKAAGPLLLWVTAQVNYAAAYTAVQPLRKRIEQISVRQGVKRTQLERTEVEITVLEKSLQQLKQDYQSIAEEIASCKTTMSVTASRCERANKLLQQLLSERERWEAESLGSDTEVATLLGNCILAAASLTYFGYFDEYGRQSLLLPAWRRQLREKKIHYREENGLGFVDYLATPTQRLEWERQGLPKDNMCAENAMILHRSRRYPLLVDPNGVAAAFLQSKYKDGTMRKTSFTKNDYLKQLDMAIRFGYALLIEDADFMDPVIGPLLSNEVRRVGDRRLTRLGGLEVETTPSFSLLLITRNSRYRPPPRIAGRVCLVNFEVTLSSLESQCSHRLLLHERPDVDEQRASAVRVREEHSLRIRVLEQELLTLIAGCEGSIIENDVLTIALERIKDQTKALKEGIAESDGLLQSITAVEAHYRPLAAAVARAYFVLRSFSQLHELYQYSVKFIFRVLDDALGKLPPPSDPNGARREQGVEGGEKCDATRLQALTYHVFHLLYHRARRGTFAQDHILLAVALGKTRSSIADAIGQQISVEEWSLFEGALSGLVVEPHTTVPAECTRDTTKSDQLPAVLSECQTCPPGSTTVLENLLQLPLFNKVRVSLNNPDHRKAWKAYFGAADPYSRSMPPFDRKEANQEDNADDYATRPTRRALVTALLLLHTRRDAFLPAVSQFLRFFFDGADVTAGKEYGPYEGPNHGSIDHRDGGSYSSPFGSFMTAEFVDLGIIQEELANNTPLILVASEGDPTEALEEVANAMNVQLHIAVMGSADSAEAAERFLTMAMMDGTWVLLKNIHVDRAFADVVIKRLHRAFAGEQVHDGFRLILSIEAKTQRATDSPGGNGRSEVMGSVETSVTLPTNLVESSVIVVYEPPSGMKASLLHTLGSLQASASRGPLSAGMLRIYLAAAWLHAVIMERLLYVPLGWSTRYEISDTEFWHTLQAIDSWVAARPRVAGKHGSGAGEEGRTCEVDRDRIPWSALQTVVGTTVYGGKVGNVFDQFLLTSFCAQMFSPAIFEDDDFFTLLEGTFEGKKIPRLPTGTLQDVLVWAKALTEPQPLRWARLPTSASRLLLERQAVATLERLAIVQYAGERGNDIHSIDESGTSDSVDFTSPFSPTEAAWARKVRRFCVSWRSSLDQLVPTGLMSSVDTARTPVARNNSSTEWCCKEPITMVVNREYTFAMERLREVLDDLQVAENICYGTGKPTAGQRALIDWLLRDQVPPMWSRSYSSHATTAEEWMIDFKRRVAHATYLHGAIKQKSGGAACFNLGLFFWPQAFITATKQQTARRQNQPLERLQSEVNLLTEEGVRARAAKAAKEDDAWHIVGLSLFSASLKGGANDADSGGTCVSLPASCTVPFTPVGAVVRWRLTPATDVTTGAGATKSTLMTWLASRDKTSGWLSVPLYASDRRKVLLQVVELKVDIENTPVYAWYEQGICLVAWSTNAY